MTYSTLNTLVSVEDMTLYSVRMDYMPLERGQESLMYHFKAFCHLTLHCIAFILNTCLIKMCAKVQKEMSDSLC